MFLSFFVDKVTDIRSKILPSCSPGIDCLARVSLLSQYHWKISQPLSLHTPPLALLTLFHPFCKNVLSSLRPYFLSIVNSSLSFGCVPDYYEHAIIQPLLKKPSLNPLPLGNYRPISKLPFISKVLKVVCYYYYLYMSWTAMKSLISTSLVFVWGTVLKLLRLSNHILTRANVGECSVLLLLDLSAAFQSVLLIDVTLAETRKKNNTSLYTKSY